MIDELHVLRGVFGTHVAHILRRLRRICRHYGSDPVFVFTSATIGQPERLASALCAAPVTAITDDGSPTGPRRFALLDPPVIDEETGVRARPTARWRGQRALVESGHRTITFCQSRKGTELIAADISRRVSPHLKRAVMSYRAGYLAEERRAIEEQMSDGTLRGIVATSALELGVDIGDLDACVINGFPGTIASMWQQAGAPGDATRQASRTRCRRRPTRPLPDASPPRGLRATAGAIGDQYREPPHPRPASRMCGLRTPAVVRRCSLVERRGTPRWHP